MIDLASAWRALADTPLAPWLAELQSLSEAKLALDRHGDMVRWQEVLQQLPALPIEEIQLDSDAIAVGAPLEGEARLALERLLRRLHPWRKGPYTLHGVHIDSEWRSDLKWNRLKDHIQPLKGRTVLDVGCGNGYHCWRMAGAGAERVVGIDPTLLYMAQFFAIKHFLGENHPVYLLPLTLEEMPHNMRLFDTLFSMGVLYHRRSPFDHLTELRNALRPGGELVLETLVIEAEEGSVLVPEGRYAKMKNVWFLPSPPTLLAWLRRAGFRDARVIDVSPTTSAEQRRTGWMEFESLADYLDPQDTSQTVEGHPAPLRAIIVAQG